jgi:hypothetical protein
VTPRSPSRGRTARGSSPARAGAAPSCAPGRSGRAARSSGSCTPTRAPEDAAEAIARALADARVAGGNFAIRFDGASGAARFLTWLYPKLRLLGLRYGDSAIFVRRDAYERAGGFRPFPIFEDLDLVGRVRRRARFVTVPSVVVTSSRRFEGRSFGLTFARWAGLQVLYWLGVSPHRLGALYSAGRSKGSASVSPSPSSPRPS